MRYSFHIPLLTRLRASGLRLDQDTANVEVRRWLADVANARLHAHTKRVPADALVEERPALQPLPAPYRGLIVPARAAPARRQPELPSRTRYAVVPPQHALSLYDQLLGVAR